MLEFTASDEMVKRSSDLKWLSAFLVGGMLLAVFIELFASGGVRVDGFIIGALIVAVVIFGAAYWFLQRTSRRQAKGIVSQRVTLGDEGIENYNDLWQEVYSYEDIEKLTVVRSKSSEVKGVALQLPKKVIDFSTLGRQEEFY